VTSTYNEYTPKLWGGADAPEAASALKVDRNPFCPVFLAAADAQAFTASPFSPFVLPTFGKVMAKVREHKGTPERELDDFSRAFGFSSVFLLF